MNHVYEMFMNLCIHDYIYDLFYNMLYEILYFYSIYYFLNIILLHFDYESEKINHTVILARS